MVDSDVDPESSGDIGDLNSGQEKGDAGILSRRQTTFLLILVDVLFAIILFIVFLIFLTTAGDEAASLDFVHLLPYLGAGHCFAPVISMTNTRKVAIAPNHRVLFNGVQSFLLKQSTEDMRSLLVDCKAEQPLQVCLLTKVCPHFGDQHDSDRYGRQEVMVRGRERIPNLPQLVGRRRHHPVRFDMLNSDAKDSRAKFKIYESDYAEDLKFCNALFSYVLLSTNMSLTSNLAENYTYTLEEPHEVEHVLLIFLSEPAFAGIRHRAHCDRFNIQCLLESMCEKEVFRV